jgi:hypothetical protein
MSLIPFFFSVYNLRLHLEGLEVMLELQVDCTFRSGQSNFVHMFNRRDIVDLCDILPDKYIQEALCEVVSAMVPCRRVHLPERVESFRRRLLLRSSFLGLRRPLPVVFDTEVDTHECSDGSDRCKVTDRRCSGKHPFIR